MGRVVVGMSLLTRWSNSAIEEVMLCWNYCSLRQMPVLSFVSAGFASRPRTRLRLFVRAHCSLRLASQVASVRLQGYLCRQVGHLSRHARWHPHQPHLRWFGLHWDRSFVPLVVQALKVALSLYCLAFSVVVDRLDLAWPPHSRPQAQLGPGHWGTLHNHGR